MEKFLLGVAVGALAVFMFDPQQGRRRRALVRDKIVHGKNVSQDYIESTARHLRNKAEGYSAKVRSLASREGARAVPDTEATVPGSTPAIPG